MVRRFLDTKDSTSTSNLRKHVESCWGKDALEAGMATGTAKDARESVVKEIKGSGSITAAFERKGKGKVTFSHRQHTKTETKSVTLPSQALVLYLIIICRAEIVRWVAEDLRPFKIVEDRGFQKLMKTGRPEYYLPSPSTVSRDVQLVFVNARKRIAKMLQVRQSLQ